MKELLLKGALSGVVAGIATKVVFGESQNVQLLNMSYPAPIVVGVGVSAGSLASDLVSEQLIEKFNLPQNVKSGSEFALRAGVCGAVSTGVLIGLTGLPMSSAVNSFALGAGSKLGGDYIYDKALSPEHGFMPIF